MSFLSDLVNASLATHVLSGNRSGYDYDWMNIPKTKLYTNVFIVDEKEGKVRHRRHAMPVRGVRKEFKPLIKVIRSCLVIKSEGLERSCKKCFVYRTCFLTRNLCQI